MPVFEVSVPAPEDTNQLVRYEALAGPAPSSGSAPIKTAADDAKNQDGGFWAGTAAFLRSDGFKDLAKTGMSSWQAHETKKWAEKEAKNADQRSMVQSIVAINQAKKAQEDIAAARRLQAAAAQHSMTPVVQAAPVSVPNAGLPGWVIPAALGGAGLVLVFFLMNRKRSAP